MITAAATRVNAAPIGVDLRGKVFRDLLEWGMRERKRCLQHGWNRLDADFVRSCMRPLETWLAQHPFVSTEAGKALWAKHQREIRFVMPGNAAGRKKLLAIEHWIASVQSIH